MTQSMYPAGWNPERVQRLIDHYESASSAEPGASTDRCTSVLPTARSESPDPSLRGTVLRYDLPTDSGRGPSRRLGCPPVIILDTLLGFLEGQVRRRVISPNEVVIEGPERDGTLELDQKPNLAPGQVQVILQLCPSCRRVTVHSETTERLMRSIGFQYPHVTSSSLIAVPPPEPGSWLRSRNRVRVGPRSRCWLP